MKTEKKRSVTKKKQAGLVNPGAWPTLMRSGSNPTYFDQEAEKYVRQCLIGTKGMIGQKMFFII